MMGMEMEMEMGATRLQQRRDRRACRGRGGKGHVTGMGPAAAPTNAYEREMRVEVSPHVL